MASKKRNGLSKNEYKRALAAKAAPKSNTRSLASKSSSKGYSDPTLAAEMNPVGATINPGRQNQPLVINDSGPLQPGQKRSNAKTDNKGSSKSSSSSKKPSALAGGLFGIPSASADTGPKEINITPVATGRNTLGKFLTGARAAASVLPGMGILKNVGDLGISERLGLNTKEYGMTIPTDETGAVLGVQDQGLVNDIVQKNNGVLPDDAVDLLQQGRNRQKARSVFQDEGFGAASQFVNSSPASSSSIRTPRAIAGGNFTPAPQPVSSIVPQIMGGLDYTPVDNGQPGTRRRFLGNGLLSNGIASNGKLDSEFAGASFGMPTDGMGNLFDEDMINNILGINTAQAAEMPMGTTDFQSSPQLSSFSPYASNQGETAASAAGRFQSLFGNPVGQNEQSNDTRVQNPGGSQNGGVTQQFAQGATGGNPLQDYYQGSLKGFSAQEKAQKKALKELLKSIKSQYQTQQTTGIDQLNKAKQEDLLKLSGLFSFANQDPDSEQRIQYEQRANQDYANQQGDFLAKLAAAQAQEESRARQGYQGEIANIASQRNSAQEKIAQLLFQAQQDAQSRGGGSRPLSGTAAGSVTYMGDNASGEPVYRNNQTGQMQVGTGLTRKSQDPYAQMLAGLMGGTKGTMPFMNGQQVQYDEQGRPYIEQ